MMPDLSEALTIDPGVLLAIAIMAVVTLAVRVAGSAVMEVVPFSPRVERFLEAMASAVIAAIVANVLAANGLREAASVAVAILIMLASRSALWAMIAGTAFAAVWSGLVG